MIRIAPNRWLIERFTQRLMPGPTVPHTMRPHSALLICAALATLALATALPCFATAKPARSDDDRRAYELVRRGEFVALERLLDDALQRVPGKVIDIDLDDDEYELKVLDADGVIWELEYDARSGRLLELERDD